MSELGKVWTANQMIVAFLLDAAMLPPEHIMRTEADLLFADMIASVDRELPELAQNRPKRHGMQMRLRFEITFQPDDGD